MMTLIVVPPTATVAAAAAPAAPAAAPVPHDPNRFVDHRRGLIAD